MRNACQTLQDTRKGINSTKSRSRKEGRACMQAHLHTHTPNIPLQKSFLEDLLAPEAQGSRGASAPAALWVNSGGGSKGPLPAQQGQKRSPNQGSRARFIQQTCRGLFSAELQSIFAIKYSSCKIFQDLQDLHISAKLH